MIKILSQRDKRWATIKLGESNLILGRYGCTTCCISMLSDYFGSFHDPADLAVKTLKYTADGLILWQSVNNIEHMAFEKRLYKRNDAEILKSLKDPKGAVILEVANYSHWVVAIGKTLLGNDYKIVDPWDATICKILKKYHNITGSSHFIRK